MVGDHLDNRANHTYLILALMVFVASRQELTGAAAPEVVAAAGVG